MKKCKYVNSFEDIEKNKNTLFCTLCSKDMYYSGAADIGSYGSADEKWYYRVKDYLTLSAWEIRCMARSYLGFFQYEISKDAPFEKDYVLNTLKEILEIMYDCGHSLKTNCKDIEMDESYYVNPAKYPISLLDLPTEIIDALLKKDICYVGEYLEMSYLDILRILSPEDINKVYISISAETGINVYEQVNARMTEEMNVMQNELLYLEVLSNMNEKSKIHIMQK